MHVAHRRVVVTSVSFFDKLTAITLVPLAVMGLLCLVIGLLALLDRLDMSDDPANRVRRGQCLPRCPRVTVRVYRGLQTKDHSPHHVSRTSAKISLTCSCRFTMFLVYVSPSALLSSDCLLSRTCRRTFSTSLSATVWRASTI